MSRSDSSPTEKTITAPLIPFRPIRYRTVASASEEAQLLTAERDHICGEDDDHLSRASPEFEDPE